jgi:hypothetical protein
MKIPSPIKGAFDREKWIGVRPRIYHEGYRAFITNPMTGTFISIGRYDTAYDAAKGRFLEILKMDPIIANEIRTDFVPDKDDTSFLNKVNTILKTKEKEKPYNLLNYESMGFPYYPINPYNSHQATVTNKRTRKMLEETFPNYPSAIAPRNRPQNDIYTMHLKHMDVPLNNVNMNGGKGSRRMTRRRRNSRNRRNTRK